MQKRRKRFKSFNYGQVVGDYVADIVVEKKIICELKSTKEINPAHEAQLVNYLKATGLEVGLLINFGEQVRVKRKIFDKHGKPLSFKNID